MRTKGNVQFTVRCKASAIAIYLKEISRIRTVSMDQEVDLVTKVQQGDKIALDELVRVNLRFVVTIARQYQHKNVDLADLISEGNIGLIKAAKRYDSSLGFKFLSYAGWWIRQSIHKALIKHLHIVHLPQNHIELLNKIRKLKDTLEQQLQRQPSLQEIADYLEEKVENVAEVNSVYEAHVSLYQPSSSDAEITFIEFLSDESFHADRNLNCECIAKTLRNCIKQLPQRESEVIRLHYGIDEFVPLSFGEISGKYSISAERIRQIKEQAINRLRTQAKQVNELLP